MQLITRHNWTGRVSRGNVLELFNIGRITNLRMKSDVYATTKL